MKTTQIVQLPSRKTIYLRVATDCAKPAQPLSKDLLYTRETHFSDAERGTLETRKTRIRPCSERAAKETVGPRSTYCHRRVAKRTYTSVSRCGTHHF
jgi:hypothetical protein